MSDTVIVASPYPAQARKLSLIVAAVDASVVNAVTGGLAIPDDVLKMWAETRTLWAKVQASYLTPEKIDRWRGHIRKSVGFLRDAGVPIGDQSSAGADPLVWTPSAVRAELERAKTIIETLDHEMKAQPEYANGIFLQTWTMFQEEFQHFVKSDPTTWSGATATLAQEYEVRAAAFSKALVDRGGESVAMLGWTAPGSLSLVPWWGWLAGLLGVAWLASETLGPLLAMAFLSGHGGSRPKMAAGPKEVPL